MNLTEISNLQSLSSNNVLNLEFIVNLFMCIIMSFILKIFYVNKSYSLTGKNHIGSIIPILSIVVFLVIMVVKSSLALSLGLVGALSIVRFRTPIKEPEELVYLFLSISIGLGYGAGQTLITTSVIFVVLLVIYFFLSNKSSQTKEYNLVIDWDNADIDLSKILNSIEEFFESVKLVRYDKSNNSNHAVLLIYPKNSSSLNDISNHILKINPNISITFFEAKTNW